jgi:hypothetical protein
MASYRPLGERPTLEKCLIWGTHTINESASGNRLRKAGAFLVWIFKAENPWTIGFNQCTTNQNWGESIARRSSTVNRKPSRFRTLENEATIRKPATTQRGWSVLLDRRSR